MIILLCLSVCPALSVCICVSLCFVRVCMSRSVCVCPGLSVSVNGPLCLCLSVSDWLCLSVSRSVGVYLCLTVSVCICLRLSAYVCVCLCLSISVGCTPLDECNCFGYYACSCTLWASSKGPSRSLWRHHLCLTYVAETVGSFYSQEFITDLRVDLWDTYMSI